MQHHTLPGEASKVIPPSDLPITFDLVSLWSQQTYDGPQQLWRATSNHNLRVRINSDNYTHIILQKLKENMVYLFFTQELKDETFS